MPPGETTRRGLFVSPIDDSLIEGDETVTVRLIEPPIESGFAYPPYQIDPERDRATVIIHDNDPPDTRPVVGIELLQREAAETHPFQNAIFWAEFRVSRTGSLSNELIVSFNTQGSANLDEDYWLEGVEGSTVRFVPDQSAVNVRLYPIDDQLPEGDELPIVELTANPLPAPYTIDPEHASVEMVIHDNDPEVSITSTAWKTAEPCPVCLVAPAVFTVSRTGATNALLNVYLQYDGTATARVDYGELWHVTIPAGKVSTDLLVLANDDLLVEGLKLCGRGSCRRHPGRTAMCLLLMRTRPWR